MNSGVLLLNVGSPDAPTAPAARRYLREFLLDARVLDMPWLLRYALVYGVILPSRPARTAAAYQRIWGPEGSPLLVGSRRLRQALEAQVDVPVALAMRYGQPSLSEALGHLAGQGVQRLLVLPLFPQWAKATVVSAVERVRAVTRALALTWQLEVVPPFFNDPAFLEALEKIKPKKIVYISCDPNTLSRDLARMVRFGYLVKRAQPVDMFCQTFHVETVVCLERKQI